VQKKAVGFSLNDLKIDQQIENQFVETGNNISSAMDKNK